MNTNTNTEAKINVRKVSDEKLDAIIKRTKYASQGVAIGGAAADQDLYYTAWRELGRRMGFEE